MRSDGNSRSIASAGSIDCGGARRPVLSSLRPERADPDPDPRDLPPNCAAARDVTPAAIRPARMLRRENFVVIVFASMRRLLCTDAASHRCRGRRPRSCKVIAIRRRRRRENCNKTYRAARLIDVWTRSAACGCDRCGAHCRAQRRCTTISTYSLGTTSERGPATLLRSRSSIRSFSSAEALSEASDANAL